MDSLLARVTRADVVEEPFPHVVVRDPLDPQLCDRLIAAFPPFESMEGYRADASNLRINYRAKDVLADKHLISPLWRELVERHVSQGFLDEQLKLFEESIKRTYPSCWKSFAESPPRAGVRWSDTFESADVLLEAQPAANTAVTRAASSVRAGHLDNPDKLLVGLYYLRHPEDDSSGGDLQLYRYAKRRAVFEGQEISNRYIEVVKTIPYERNVLVLFLNTPNSLHGVTPREPTSWPRLFLNLDAVVNKDLFAIPTNLKGRLARRARANVRTLASAFRA